MARGLFILLDFLCFVFLFYELYDVHLVLFVLIKNLVGDLPNLFSSKIL